MIIAFAFVKYNKDQLFGKREHQKLLLLQSALGTIGIVLFFYAIDHLILSDAEMLNKMSPFLTIVFAAIFLKEHFRHFQVVAVLVAFFCALFIIKTEFNFEILPSIAENRDSLL